jgi:tripartite-type tricarboxylate transporter receptor subunit TctC
MKIFEGKSNFVVSSLIITVMLMGIIGPTFADNFPDKPIEFIVIFTPGGVTDLSMRAIAEIASKELGQPFVVINKGGAGGSIGTAAIAKAKPDGYTVGSLSVTPMEVQPHLTKLSYDPIKEIVPIMQYGEYPQGIAVKADSPFNTLKDLIEYSKKNPGKVSYGTTAVGGTQHIMMERIAGEAGVKWIHVPFKGDAPAVTALLGGHITATALSGAFPQAKAGNAKILAVFNAKRLSEFPNVPTLQELGYNLSMSNYLAIGAPAGVPKDRLEKLGKAFKNAMKDPYFLENMKKLSIEVDYKSSNELERMIREGYKMHGELIKKLGLAEKAKSE